MLELSKSYFILYLVLRIRFRNTNVSFNFHVYYMHITFSKFLAFLIVPRHMMVFETTETEG